MLLSNQNLVPQATPETFVKKDLYRDTAVAIVVVVANRVPNQAGFQIYTKSYTQNYQRFSKQSGNISRFQRLYKTDFRKFYLSSI